MSLKSSLLSLEIAAALPMWGLFSAIKKGNVQRFDRILSWSHLLFRHQPLSTDVLWGQLYKAAYETDNADARAMVECASRHGLRPSPKLQFIQMQLLTSQRKADALHHMFTHVPLVMHRDQAHVLALVMSSTLCTNVFPSSSTIGAPLPMDLPIMLVNQYQLDLLKPAIELDFRNVGEITRTFVPPLINLWDLLVTNIPANQQHLLINLFDTLPPHKADVHLGLLQRCAENPTFEPSLALLEHMHQAGQGLDKIVHAFVQSQSKLGITCPSSPTPRQVDELLATMNLLNLRNAHRQLVATVQSRTEQQELTEQVNAVRSQVPAARSRHRSKI